jgi:urease accessory protein
MTAAADSGGDASLSRGALIELMRLASPALPVGAFSYSEGLEAAVECARVRDEATTTGWLTDQLHLSVGRSELPVFIAAQRAWHATDHARVRELNAWVLATRESREWLLQTEQTGRSLLDWLRRRAPADHAAVAAAAALQPAPAWPVVFALATARSGASLHDGALAFALGWAENMVQAAIKAVPLGQHAGQRVLDALAPQLPAAIDAALAMADDERQAFAPMLAILSAQHETQYSRLFRS